MVEQREVLLQQGDTVVAVRGSDDLKTLAQCAHVEFDWLLKKERAEAFAEWR